MSAHTARGVPLLPLAVLLVLVPALVAGGRSASTGATEDVWATAPVTVDLIAERDAGVELVVASGYRSAEEQLHDLETEVVQRGSAHAEACPRPAATPAEAAAP